jgi:hypothetical protein
VFYCNRPQALVLRSLPRITVLASFLFRAPVLDLLSDTATAWHNDSWHI